MNPIYNIWNDNYIRQQAQQQHHFEQIKQVQDTAKALKDFLDGTQKIEPTYQDYATKEFCTIIFSYLSTRNT